MYASKHPFRDDLVLEISEHEILELHGALLTTSRSNVANALLSILEAFNAGTDMSRFAREDDGHDDPADDQLSEPIQPLKHRRIL